jgi:hypothetical protein
MSNHLQQTAAWCLHTMRMDDLNSTTRTEEIRPDIFITDDHIQQLDALHQGPESLFKAVTQICKRRRKMVKEFCLKLPTLDYCLTAGRIFCTNFDTDSCAAATDTSNGFFDLSDIPGWDTWFAFEPNANVGDLVYGWVPNEATVLVGRGMLMIPVQSVWWVDDVSGVI